MRDLIVAVGIALTFLGCDIRDYRIEHIVRGVAKEYRYIPEDEGDDWKPPAQTMRDGGGDCEDLAILAIYRLSQVGLKADLVVYKWVQNGRAVYHAFLQSGMCFYDPSAKDTESTYWGKGWEHCYTIPYENVMANLVPERRRY